MTAYSSTRSAETVARIAGLLVTSVHARMIRRVQIAACREAHRQLDTCSGS